MMSEQTANLCTTDACESLRARLAKYEDAEGNPIGGKAVAWQFQDKDGQWYTGMETNDHRAHTERAGYPTRDLCVISAPSHGEQVEEIARLRELLTAWRRMFDGGIASGELGVLRGQTDAALAKQ